MRSTRSDGEHDEHDEQSEAVVMSERGRTAGPSALARAVPARPSAAPAGPTGNLRVLIVEDEPALLRALRIDLRARGFEVHTASRAQEALDQAARWPPDAVLLDLGLPDRDGTEVIQELRTWSNVPVIVLSGRSAAQDKIVALDAGADDYVTKPFAMDELLARLRAALRREDAVRPATAVTIGRTQVDLAAHKVVRQPAGGGGAADGQPGPGAEPVHLTPTEWRLLEILLRAPGQLVPSSRLLAQVWGSGFEHNAHYLRFHMARLRRKLEEDPPRPRHLLTEPGMGYRYQP
ncbi:MAG TPA: response regulator [Streptosporangiaceae bacterium]|nr:response regulator [Streptosporangiaceae bacterium]